MIEIRWVEEETRQLPEGGDAAMDFDFGLLALDIVEGDSYEVTSLVTEHSVESREQITDHQVPQLDRVSVDVVVGESPASRTIGEGTTMSEVRLSTGTTVSVITAPEGTTRIADIFDSLRRLCREGIAVDVDGLRRPIEGWMIEAISSSRDVQTAGALTCTISLVEVSVAATSEVDAPSPRVERARPAAARGQGGTTAAGDSAVAPEPQYRETATESIREDFYNTETGEPF